MHEKDLTGKIALVTGAAKGLGRAIAEKLARQGATVAVADINVELAEQTAAGIVAEGGQAFALAMDVGSEESVDRAFAEMQDRYGGLDILVNNAGIVNNNPVDVATVAEWDRVININLKGVYLCMMRGYRLMKARGGGRIISLASMGGQQGGLKSGADYCASKAGIEGMSKTFARQIAKHNINVNCVAPGLIETDMTRGNYDPKTVPLLRLGVPEDVANAVYFLASDLGSYITGTTIDVNGGVLMR